MRLTNSGKTKKIRYLAHLSESQERKASCLTPATSREDSGVVFLVIILVVAITTQQCRAPFGQALTCYCNSEGKANMDDICINEMGSENPTYSPNPARECLNFQLGSVAYGIDILKVQASSSRQPGIALAGTFKPSL